MPFPDFTDYCWEIYTPVHSSATFWHVVVLILQLFYDNLYTGVHCTARQSVYKRTTNVCWQDIV